METAPSFSISSRAEALTGTFKPATLAGAQEEFASVLGRHGVGAARIPSDIHGRARDAAAEFVAVSLVQPILEEARESSMAAEPFAVSSAQKQFRALQDAALAQRITKAAHFPLVDRLASTLVRQKGAQA